MRNVLRKYGKQTTKTLLDLMVIKQHNIKDEDVRDLLIENKIITKSTKYLMPYGVKLTGWGGQPLYKLTIKNGKGTYILNAEIKESEIPQLLEQLQ